MGLCFSGEGIPIPRGIDGLRAFPGRTASSVLPVPGAQIKDLSPRRFRPWRNRQAQGQGGKDAHRRLQFRQIEIYFR